MPPPPTLPAAADRLQDLLARHPGRVLLGLTGPPGAGKSTLAAALRAQAGSLGPDTAVVVPMDGFHLAHAELQRLGRADRKGAPDTFDAAGFVALLERLRTAAPDEVVYAPLFRRDLEEPVAGALPVGPAARLIIVEGNYLLFDQGPWARVAGLLDEAWYLDLDDAVRRERLARRHRQFGRSAGAAQAWVEHTDEPNARLIAATRPRAHWVWDVRTC